MTRKCQGVKCSGRDAEVVVLEDERAMFSCRACAVWTFQLGLGIVARTRGGMASIHIVSVETYEDAERRGQQVAEILQAAAAEEASDGA